MLQQVEAATPMPTIALSVEDAAQVSGIGRTSLFRAIKEGDLPAKKVGRRTVITTAALLAWIEGKPDARAGRNV